MTTQPNLFPDLPVTSLENASSADVTFPTDAVNDARALAGSYVQGVANHGTGSLLARIEGEYGSGKTHLLLATREAILRETERLALPAPVILATPSIEAAPLEWYREGIGTEIQRAPLEELVVELYSRAAQNTARLSMLTTGAVERMQDRPALARELVTDEWLNQTAVEGTFSEHLEYVCPDATDSVRHALSLLLWDRCEMAQRWLAGRSLSDRDVALTGLPRVLANEQEILGVITAIAGLAHSSGRPFVLLVDEFEHFVRYDRAHSSATNVTWLKRLLEHLSAHSAFVMVAGHPSAWTTERDLLDRFSAGQVLRLTPLCTEQVQKIADLFSRREGVLEKTTAEEVTRYSRGNMRSALAMLRSLSEVTDGFARPPTPADLSRIDQALATRVQPDVAIERLTALLHTYGFSVSYETEVAPGIRVDLVAEYEGVPVIFVERHRAAYQSRQHDQLQNFLERTAAVRRATGAAAGLFLSEGSLDRRVELLLEGNELDVYAYDLTRPDFIEQVQPIVEELAEKARSRPGARGGDLQSDRHAAQLVDSVEAIKRLDAPLYANLRSSPSEIRTLPEAAFSESRDRPREVFELLTERPGRGKRNRMLFSSPARLLPLLIVVAGIALVILAPTFARLSYPETGASFESMKLVLHIVGGLCTLLAGFVIGYRLYAIDNYHDFRDRVLRDLLLRGAAAEALIMSSSILEETLEEVGPGARAREVALKRLRDERLPV